MNDSIAQESNNIANTYARVKYHSDKLISDNQELIKQKQDEIVISGFSITSFIMGVCVFFYIPKSKQLKVVQVLQKDTEKYYDSILTIKNKISKVKSTERQELAKELHDGIMNKIFVTRFLLMQIEPEELQSKKQVLIDEIQSIETNLRSISHSLALNNKFETASYSTLLIDLVELQNRNINTNFTLKLEDDIEFEVLTAKKISVPHFTRSTSKCSKVGLCP